MNSRSTIYVPSALPGLRGFSYNKALKAMGREKDRIIAEDEQGWRFRDGSVCFRCLEAPFLRRMAKDNPTDFECSYCGRHSRKAPCAISFNALMEVIGDTIRQYWGSADNEGMAWDGEDHEYVGTTYDAYDLVTDELPTITERDDLRQDIIDSLSDQVWCERGPYSLSDPERYEYSWEAFCTTVKHHTRYFFSDLTEDDPNSEKVPVGQMLDELAKLVEEAGLIVGLPSNSRLFRGRLHIKAEICDTWSALGPPPSNVAPSNRMSPAGISMFYGSLDPATAKAEIAANLDPSGQRVLTMATWTTTRAITVLDLVNVPPLPEFFASNRYDREPLIFLQNFVSTITQPVEHDGREHIEYVPTQILTEYFRHRYTSGENASRIDAILYPSAQRRRGRNVVVFVDQADLSPDPYQIQPEPVLTLVPRSLKRLRLKR